MSPCERTERGEGDENARVVVGVGVLALGEALDELELLLRQLDILLVQLVGHGRPTAIGILDALKEPVEFVARRGPHHLLAVNVVANVGQVVVPIRRDVADTVLDLGGRMGARVSYVGREREREGGGSERGRTSSVELSLA